MLTGVLPGTSQSNAAKSVGGTRQIGIWPEDVTALADQVLLGLQARLADSVWAGLRQLLREHEQRLLAALALERDPCRAGSAAAANLSVPAHELGSEGSVTTSAGKSGRRARLPTQSPVLRARRAMSQPGQEFELGPCWDLEVQLRDMEYLENARDTEFLVDMFKPPIPHSVDTAVDNPADKDTMSTAGWGAMEKLSGPSQQSSPESRPTQIREVERLGRTAKEVAAAAEVAPTPVPLPGQLCGPGGSPALLPGTEAQHHSLTIKRSSPSTTTTDESNSMEFGHSLKDWPFSLSTGDGPRSLPNEVQMAGKAHLLEEPAQAATGRHPCGVPLPTRGPEARDDMLTRVAAEPCPCGHLPNGQALGPKQRPTAEDDMQGAIRRPEKLPIAIVVEDRNVHSASHVVRQKRETELLDEIRQSCSGTFDTVHAEQRVSSPLFLRLCGILPWGQLGATYHCGVAMLAGGSVAVVAQQFYHAQSGLSSAGCSAAICLQFGNLSELLLAVGSFLGLLAIQRVSRERVLGSSESLLPALAVQENLVRAWSSADRWQALYLAATWASSVACRAVTVATYRSPGDVVAAGAFVVMSSVFLGLAYCILHGNCLICILISSYGKKVSQRTNDLAGCAREWDKLAALVRRVSHAMERAFLVFQLTAVTMLLCSFCSIMLYRDAQIWRFIPNALLAQSLILVLSKTTEVTQLCQGMPATINCLDFGGDTFSVDKHYLVEHLTYSASGFYLGEVRLTAVLGLKCLYICMLGAFGILTHFSST